MMNTTDLLLLFFPDHSDEYDLFEVVFNIMSTVESKVNPETKDKLQNKHFWGFAVGHFHNDITVTAWANLLVFFLTRVVKTSCSSSVFLIGQITDGVTTPVVGFLSDKCNTRIGKRLPWYIFGFIIVSLSFIPMFFLIEADENTRFWYYGTLGFFYCMGWSSVQVNHMSLVPSLTLNRQRRDRLNNLRSSFDYAANFTSMGIACLLFEVMDNPPLQFLLIAIISQILGTILSFVFVWTIRERELIVDAIQPLRDENDNDSVQKNEKQALLINHQIDEVNNQPGKQIVKVKQSRGAALKMWLKQPAFYLCFLYYLGVRMYSNILGGLLSFYLVDVLELGIQNSQSGTSFHLGLIPGISSAMAVLSSSRLTYFYSTFGRRKTLILGTLLAVMSQSLQLFLKPEYSWGIYIVVVLVGLARGLVVSTGVNLISEVIGSRGQQAGIVFGIYSFIDKCMLGLIIFLVTQTAAYSNPDKLSPEEVQFVRFTSCTIPVGCCVVGTIAILFYPIPQYIKKQKIKQDETEQAIN